MSYVCNNLMSNRLAKCSTRLNKVKQTGFFTAGLPRTFSKLTGILYFRENSKCHISNTSTIPETFFYRAPFRIYVLCDTLWETQA